MKIADSSDWVRISVTVARDAAGRVEETLDALGAISTTRIDAGDSPQFDGPTPGDPRWEHQKISGLYSPGVDAQAIMATIRGVVGPGAITEFDQFADENWELSGRKNFSALKISDRVWISPPWASAAQERELEIIITPGLAFGTGTHATTQLCLRALERLALADKTVLDWGCGSGILSVAALRMGARAAVGVDLDQRALTASRENAALNQVSAKLEVMMPKELDDARTYDVLVANILAGTLIELAATLDRFLKPSGTLILSGILASQAKRVRSAFAQYNLTLTREEDWIALDGHRN